MNILVDNQGKVIISGIDLRSIYITNNIDNVIPHRKGILIADIATDLNLRELQGIRDCSEAGRFPDKIDIIAD